MEATRTFTQFYPENIYNSNVELLDEEINRLYLFDSKDKQ